MNVWTTLLMAYIVLTILTYIKIVTSKKARSEHQQKRIRLEELRKIGNKTIEEQREFMDLKYPRTAPFKLTFKNVFTFVKNAAIVIPLFIGFKYVWDRFVGFDFALWQVLALMVVIPIIVNMILKRFNLQNDDILVFFK